MHVKEFSMEGDSSDHVKSYAIDKDGNFVDNDKRRTKNIERKLSSSRQFLARIKNHITGGDNFNTLLKDKIISACSR